jgi:hypothetical protein
MMEFLPASDVVLQRDEMLAALPALLSFARQAVIATFEPGDDEAYALRVLLDECLVGAHRLALREQLCMAAPTIISGE